MKIGISYFYQIRNFPKNYVPMSTAIGDPKWFHDWQGNDYIFTDKRGILNGLRLKPIINAATERCGGLCYGKEACDQQPHDCDFLHIYRNALKSIDYNTMIKGIEMMAERYANINNIKEEIVMTLIVHEAPNNPCSERQPLIDYFNSKGWDVQEFQPKLEIKEKAFDF